jgi:hypothetical protein
MNGPRSAAKAQSRFNINALEWMPTLLVPLWLCASYFNDAAAAALGLIWIGGCVVLRGLQQCGGEALARVLHPVKCVHAPVCRRGRWDRNAPIKPAGWVYRGDTHHLVASWECRIILRALG